MSGVMFDDASQLVIKLLLWFPAESLEFTVIQGIADILTITRIREIAELFNIFYSVKDVDDSLDHFDVLQLLISRDIIDFVGNS